MPDTIPNLWPEQFKINVQSPCAILNVQANLLRKLTSGILEAEVATDSTKKRTQHRLVVVAPAWNGYRHTLISVTQDSEFVYPAEVEASGLGEHSSPSYNQFGELDNPEEIEYPLAHNDEELQSLIRGVLQSPETSALIHSLIAKSNEAKEQPAVAATA